MQKIDKVYIDGAFVTPHGEEWFELFNPAKETVIGNVRLADAEDARRAIAAAKRPSRSFRTRAKRNASRCSNACTTRFKQEKTSSSKRSSTNTAHRFHVRAGWRSIRPT